MTSNFFFRAIVSMAMAVPPAAVFPIAMPLAASPATAFAQALPPAAGSARFLAKSPKDQTGWRTDSAANRRQGQARIWIKPPQASFSEFEAYIKALGPGSASYAASRLARARRQAKAFSLKKKITQAQELYLSGQGAAAQKMFRDISRLAHSADWGGGQRRIIFYSFLRQAQAESHPDKRKSLLLSAGNLVLWDFSRAGGAFGSDGSDRKLFPPPLLNELEGLRQGRPLLSVEWQKAFPHHEIVLLNGRRAGREGLSQIPEGAYRVSAFSSSRAPWQKTLSLSYLLARPPKTEALTSGYCQSLRIKHKYLRSGAGNAGKKTAAAAGAAGAAGGENILLFRPSSDDCGKNLIFSKSAEAGGELSAAAAGKASQGRAKGLLGESAPHLTEPPQAKNQKWIWLAGAGLIGLIVLFAVFSGDGSDEPPPSQGAFHY